MYPIKKQPAAFTINVPKCVVPNRKFVKFEVIYRVIAPSPPPIKINHNNSCLFKYFSPEAISNTAVNGELHHLQINYNTNMKVFGENFEI